jgi:DNA primase
MSTAVSQIKDRLQIEDVISSYLKLEKSGANLRACCPFHNEKTASFFVSPDRGSYYCFGCGAKGDIFTFVQTFEGLDFKGALKLLADKAGISLVPENKEEAHEKDNLFRLMEEATLFFQKNLSNSSDIKKYINDRGVTDETIEKWRLGFAPLSWRDLTTFLKSKNWDENLLEKAGLAKITPKGAYDRFRGRVMFPIMDSSGRVIAFSGRLVVDDGVSAKYLNSPDTMLFDKSSSLYGIHIAKDAIRKKNYSILVEGQFDLLLAHQVGTTNSVASSGTALSDGEPTGDRGISNMRMLSRLSPNIVFAFDGDKAGISATLRGTIIASKLDMESKIAILPKGKDPADLISKNPEEWLASLKNTKDAVSFFTINVKESSKDKREFVENIRKFVLPIIKSMSKPLDRSRALETVSKMTDFRIEDLRKELEANSDISSDRKIYEANPKNKNVFSIYERVFGILFWQKSLKVPWINVEDLQNKIEFILKDHYTPIHDSAFEHSEELVFQAEAACTSGLELSKEIDVLVSFLHEKHILDEMKKIRVEINSSDGERHNDLLKIYKEKTEELEKVRGRKLEST